MTRWRATTWLVACAALAGCSAPAPAAVPECDRYASGSEVGRDVGMPVARVEFRADNGFCTYHLGAGDGPQPVVHVLVSGLDDPAEVAGLRQIAWDALTPGYQLFGPAMAAANYEYGRIEGRGELEAVSGSAHLSVSLTVVEGAGAPTPGEVREAVVALATRIVGRL